MVRNCTACELKFAARHTAVIRLWAEVHMGKSKEYLAVRYDPGTADRVDELRDFVGTVHMNGRLTADDVSRSDVMRTLIRFALDIYERRADAWRAEEKLDVVAHS